MPRVPVTSLVDVLGPIVGAPSIVEHAADATSRAADRVDPDHDVLALVAAGEVAAALRHLMHRHGKAVYRYCREALRDPALADDVHQQVFIQAFRDLPRFRGRSKLRTWLFAIARNRVLDAVKVRKRAQAHLDEADLLGVPDARPPVDHALDDARLHAALIASVADLGDDVRTTVLLRYQQGFSFDEMGEIFGEKPGTLHARVARAMPVLRAGIEARLGVALRPALPPGAGARTGGRPT
ncbi:MAG TPA: RNA polymerase sigma factor [Kofleriaceae bacterium]|nr:RNA polymerase sigma factor [Kofleriaceae bacterium]